MLLVVSTILAGCGKEKPSPVVVIGLDGADFDLLVPWMEQGHLPNLKAFLDQASVGELETVYPILSPVCWTTAATGVNPGKHGIFDFQKPDPDGGAPLVETATHRRALPVWMLLSDAGYRVGVMNVPMTYPPDPVRGRMISGFPFPSEDVVITYPPELQDELGDYPLDYLGLNLFNRTPEKMYEDFLKGLDARRQVAVDWVASGDYDFMWLVFTGTDKVQHFFWKYMDPNHPNHDPVKAKTLGSAILDLWKIQDEALGEILAAVPADATVMFLSDHGFDAIYRQVNMANWVAQTDVPKWLTEDAIPDLMMTNGILHYEIPGQVPGSSDREVFIDKMIDLCRGLHDPQTGTAPFEFLFRREEIYEGRMLEKAPDIVFQENPKYYVTRGVPDSTGLPVVQDLWSTSFSAHHRPEGILALRGPGTCVRTSGSIRDRLKEGGDFDQAKIQDVAPTLLAFMGEPIPDAMDGRVLTETVCPEFLDSHPVVVQEIEGFLLDRLPPSNLTPEEKEKLKALPYIQ